MASTFTTIRRVEFADTDMAGIVHFSVFFRMMEAVEHAFLRSLGLSVYYEDDGRRIGWPRVRAECDYLSPLRFEEEVEVRLRVREKKQRSLQYGFTFHRVGDPAETVLARGTLTVVCVTMDADTGHMRSVPMPEPFQQRIEVAEAE
jgi:YbgC/YbaW family acyl-CoA thioester hydrolase